MAVAPTYFLDPTAVAARDAEYTGTPCTDDDGGGSYADPYLGCNRAGSNAPGIGINASPTETESDGAVKASDWTVLDQHAAARTPQDSQHIGDTGLGAGDTGVGSVPINIVDRSETATPDMNNVAHLADLAVGWVNTAVI